MKSKAISGYDWYKFLFAMITQTQVCYRKNKEEYLINSHVC